MFFGILVKNRYNLLQSFRCCFDLDEFLVLPGLTRWNLASFGMPLSDGAFATSMDALPVF